MLFKFFVAVSLLPLSVASEKNKTQESFLEAVYWEVKPFIFTNEDGELDGIVPKMFRSGQNYCNRNTNETKTLIKFVSKVKSRKTFFNLLKPGSKYGHGDLRNVTKTKALWVPVVASSYGLDGEHLREQKLTSFQLMKSSKIAVIVPRYLISLPNKIVRGILSCQQIFIIALLLSTLFGMIMWLIERFTNDDFSKQFTLGAATGFYWGIVSMTTVGYGDVVPRSPLGRFLALFWLSIGILIGCVMTATMTDIVAGVADLSVYGKPVAVLENSMEEKVASKDHRAQVIPAESYEQALEFVRDGTAFAAMINADVAAWIQDEIQDDEQEVPLRIVELLPANIYVNCLISLEIEDAVKKIFKCMYIQRDEVYEHSIEEYRRYCHTQTLYIGSTKDLFRENLFLQLLLGTVCTMLFIGILFDVTSYLLCKRPNLKANDNNNSLCMAHLVEDSNSKF